MNHMIDIKIASKLKPACIGIGLRKDENSGPLLISGSGFFINSEGFLITATHVIDGLEEKIEKYKKKFPEIRLAAFRVENSGTTVKVHTDTIRLRAKLRNIKPKNYTGSEKYDVTISKIEGPFKNLPFLKIKKPQKLELYKEILMCGYPGGSQTLDLNYKLRGLKTNPVLQRGMISSIMPMDTARKPVGIITDIIGTGGSSGSPIVYADDGEVISVAQNVVVADNRIILENSNNIITLIGTSKIGITYGVSNYYLEPTVKATLTQIKPYFKNGCSTAKMINQTSKGIVDEKGNYRPLES